MQCEDGHHHEIFVVLHQNLVNLQFDSVNAHDLIGQAISDMPKTPNSETKIDGHRQLSWTQPLSDKLATQHAKLTVKMVAIQWS